MDDREVPQRNGLKTIRDTSPHPVTIAEIIESCGVKFESAIAKCQSSEQNGHITSLKNEQSRFKAWKSQLTVRSPGGQRGLDFRLRDTEALRTQVIILLQDLVNDLDSPLEDFQADHVESSVEGMDDDSISLDCEHVPAAAEQEPELVRHVSHIIDHLYRLTLSLRRPSATDYLKSGGASLALENRHFDEEQVRQRFPSAPDFLLKRLGERMSRRRQLLLYRNNSDSRHTSSNHGDPSGHLADGHIDSLRITRPTEHTEMKSSALTTAATLRRTASLPGRPSLNSTVVLPLKVPPVPQRSEQDLLRCPVCDCDISIKSEKQWRHHVFDDLQPYVCIHEVCTSAYQAYSVPREWQLHVTLAHPRSWRCPFDCSCLFANAQDLESHVVDQHQVKDDQLTLTTILEACADSHDVSSSLVCPLCQSLCPSQEHWFKHVQEHQQQLALSTLPEHLLVAMSDDESDITGEEEINTMRTGRIPDVEQQAEHEPSQQFVSHNASGESSVSAWEDVAPLSKNRAAKDLPSALSADARSIDDRLPRVSRLNRTGHKAGRKGKLTQLETQLIKLLISATKKQTNQHLVENVAKAAESMDGIKEYKRDNVSEAGGPKQDQKERRREPHRKLSSGRRGDRVATDNSGTHTIDQDSSHSAPRRPVTESPMEYPTPPTGLFEYEKHFASVKLCDTFGNWFRFPYSTVHNWADMERCIMLASKGVDRDHEARVRARRYFLVDSKQLVILPELWSLCVRPGLKVRMRMWSLESPSMGPKIGSSRRSSRDRGESSREGKAQEEESSMDNTSSHSQEVEIGSTETVDAPLNQAASAETDRSRANEPARGASTVTGSHVSWADQTGPQIHEYSGSDTGISPHDLRHDRRKSRAVARPRGTIIHQRTSPQTPHEKVFGDDSWTNRSDGPDTTFRTRPRLLDQSKAERGHWSSGLDDFELPRSRRRSWQTAVPRNDGEYRPNLRRSGRSPSSVTVSPHWRGYDDYPRPPKREKEMAFVPAHYARLQDPRLNGEIRKRPDIYY